MKEIGIKIPANNTAYSTLQKKKRKANKGRETENLERVGLSTPILHVYGPKE